MKSSMRNFSIFVMCLFFSTHTIAAGKNISLLKYETMNKSEKTKKFDPVDMEYISFKSLTDCPSGSCLRVTFNGGAPRVFELSNHDKAMMSIVFSDRHCQPDGKCQSPGLLPKEGKDKIVVKSGEDETVCAMAAPEGYRNSLFLALNNRSPEQHLVLGTEQCWDSSYAFPENEYQKKAARFLKKHLTEILNYIVEEKILEKPATKNVLKLGHGEGLVFTADSIIEEAPAEYSEAD